MQVDVREIVAALEAAIEDQRVNLASDDSCYEEGYFDGLERAANIVVIKAHGLTPGVESPMISS
jgi:hypothetical protein